MAARGREALPVAIFGGTGHYIWLASVMLLRIRRTQFSRSTRRSREGQDWFKSKRVVVAAVGGDGNAFTSSLVDL